MSAAPRRRAGFQVCYLRRGEGPRSSIPGDRSMSRRVVLVTVLVALVAPARAHAQAKFTLDQLGKIVGVSSPNVSPDGKSVVFVVAKPNYTNDKNESDIYLVDLAGGAPRALT